MKVGPMLPQAGSAATRERIIRVAQTAEGAGYDSVWTNDHVVFPREYTSKYPYSPTGKIPGRVTVEGSLLEPLTELAFVAAVTSRVELGTAVLVLPMRHPVLHAKIMASIDHLAGGRLIIGAGLGWAKEEFEVLDVPFERRGARFEECVKVMRALWTGEYVDFDGEFYHLDGWTSRPVPPRPIPILVGGHGPVQMRRIGQLADGWLTQGNSVPTLMQDFEPARQAAIEAGRNPDDLVIAMTGIGLLAKDSLEDAAERLHRAKEAGVHHATIGIHPREMESAPELIEAFASKYLKELQA